jgi:hypothetical protein
MTDKVNGAVNAGEFLTGNMDFFTVVTLVPVGVTNVTTPVVDLPGYQTYVNTAVWTTVNVIDGTGTSQPYATLNAYLDAFYKQLNLNNLLATFGGRANPVAVSVNTLTGNIPGTSTPINASTGSASTLFAYYNLYNNIATPTQVFGSNYTTGKTFYTIHLATEHTLLWTAGLNANFSTTVAADETNLNGYKLLSDNATYGGLDGVVAYDLQSSQALDDSAQGSDTTNYYYLKNGVQPYVSTWNASSSTETNTLAAQGYVLNVKGV